MSSVPISYDIKGTADLVVFLKTKLLLQLYHKIPL